MGKLYMKTTPVHQVCKSAFDDNERFATEQDCDLDNASFVSIKVAF